MIEIAARGIVDGSAEGPALVSAEAISFLGDVDIRSGAIVGELPSVKGRTLGGTVLVDSAKQAKYVRDMIQCDTLLAPTEKVVDAAITGRLAQ